jgi:hypothetical protein
MEPLKTKAEVKKNRARARARTAGLVTMLGRYCTMHAKLCIIATMLAGPFVGVVQAQVAASSTTHSPAKMGTNTFRFRPAAIEFRGLGTRRQSYYVVIKIDDKKIPADYFVPALRRVWDTDEEPLRQRLKDIMAKDDGYITVSGVVRERIPRDKHTGRPEAWVDGRAIHGSIVGLPPLGN